MSGNMKTPQVDKLELAKEIPAAVGNLDDVISRLSAHVDILEVKLHSVLGGEVPAVQMVHTPMESVMGAQLEGLHVRISEICSRIDIVNNRIVL